MDAIKAAMLSWVQEGLSIGLTDLEDKLGEIGHASGVTVEHSDITKSETLLRVAGLPSGGPRYFHVKVKEML